MIILEKGRVPHVDFLKDELYRIVDRYIHLKITSNSLIYIPSYEKIKNCYLNKNISLDYLIGNKCHTNDSFELYNSCLENIKPSEKEYFMFLFKVAKKLFYLNNSSSDVLAFFQKYITENNPNIPYPFEDELLEICYKAEQEHLKSPYIPSFKCVVFNPIKNINSTFKQIIHSKEIGKLNGNIISNNCKNKTIKQIADTTNLAEITVRKHLKKQEKSTIGNKKNQTISQIKKWRKKNPKGKQKDCVNDLKMGISTIKSYWNK